jgi:aryl-alcohol dehydrogenase-like predicted oxidoreductase
MSDLSPELALGTVQFGLAYGIAGSGERVRDREASAILAAAHESGVRMLDTASGYGDIEERLVGLFPANTQFTVTSKIAAVPPQYLHPQSDPVGIREYLTTEIDRSLSRLGSHLTTLLFHRPEDLDGPDGPAIWNAASEHATKRGLVLGVSLYDVRQRPRGCGNEGVRVAQCPANVLDQRLLDAAEAPRLPAEIHVRSAFLQGLLLMPEAAATQRLPAARESLRKWHEWCAERSLSPVHAALGFVKSLPIRYCVLGVESCPQFAEIRAAWRDAKPLRAPELSESDLNVIDPRTWRTRKIDP